MYKLKPSRSQNQKQIQNSNITKVHVKLATAATTIRNKPYIFFQMNGQLIEHALRVVELSQALLHTRFHSQPYISSGYLVQIYALLQASRYLPSREIDRDVEKQQEE